MARTLLIAVIAALSSNAHAGCKELAAAMENALKEAADIEIRGPEERGQTTATVQQRIANQLATVNANVLLMDRAKCPMPQDPIGVGNLNPYTAAARDCARVATGSCDRGAWKRATP